MYSSFMAQVMGVVVTTRGKKDVQVTMNQVKNGLSLVFIWHLNMILFMSLHQRNMLNKNDNAVRYLFLYTIVVLQQHDCPI